MSMTTMHTNGELLILYHLNGITCMSCNNRYDCVSSKIKFYMLVFFLLDPTYAIIIIIIVEICHEALL